MGGSWCRDAAMSLGEPRLLLITKTKTSKNGVKTNAQSSASSASAVEWCSSHSNSKIGFKTILQNRRESYIYEHAPGDFAAQKAFLES
jgi:hypothetical protein